MTLKFILGTLTLLVLTACVENGAFFNSTKPTLVSPEKPGKKENEASKVSPPQKQNKPLGNITPLAAKEVKPVKAKPLQPATAPISKRPLFVLDDKLWTGGTSIIRTPTDPLPKRFDAPAIISLSLTPAQALRVVLGRLEAHVNKSVTDKAEHLRFQIEERPSRYRTSAAPVPLAGRDLPVGANPSAGPNPTLGPSKNVTLPPAPHLSVTYVGSLRGLLDKIAGKTGYRWDYSKSSNTVAFYRYHDAEYANNLPKPKSKWEIDPARHKSLRLVFASWAKAAGWSFSWDKNVPDYLVSAKASYKGSFKEAVSAVANENKVTTAFAPWFYSQNKHLVIKPGKVAP